MRVIRKFRPHVVTTYDENGGYPHPDHIRCHQVSVAAYEAAGDHLLFPDAGEPWDVQKLYYTHGFLRQRMQLLQDEFAKHGQVGPFEKWLKHWDPDHDIFAKRVTTRIECAKYFAQRDDALRAHATQIDPNGRLLPGADRMAATAMADRGVRVGALPGAGVASGDRPVRRDRDGTSEATASEDRSEARSMGRTASSRRARTVRRRDGHERRRVDHPGCGAGPSRDTGPDFGKASPFGLLVIVLLLIGTFLLVWSMNRHLRKLPKSFDDEDSGPGQADPNPADGSNPQVDTDAPTDETKREPG